ncbi:MAG: DUF5615 family PIN-like protein [Bacillota bacterium]
MEKHKTLSFLADVNVEKMIIETIKEFYYDVKCVSEIKPNMLDEDVIKLANFEKRVLITNDKDFGELIYRQNLLSSGVIMFRIKGHNTREKINIFRKLLLSYNDKLCGYLVIITVKRFRFIVLPEVTKC